MNETGVSAAYVRTWLVEVLASYLEVPADEVETDLPMLELGLDSLYRWEIGQEINRQFNIKIEKGVIKNTSTTDTVADLIVAMVNDATAPAQGQGQA